MRARELGPLGSSLGATLVALALPKCPLCILGLLSAVGIGGSLVETVVPVVRRAALSAGLVLSLVLAAALVARRARRRTCPDCARPPRLTRPIRRRTRSEAQGPA